MRLAEELDRRYVPFPRTKSLDTVQCTYTQTVSINYGALGASMGHHSDISHLCTCRNSGDCKLVGKLYLVIMGSVAAHESLK